MKKITDFLDRYARELGACVIIIGIFLFVGYKMNHTRRYGLITVARVVRYEGAVSGSDLYIDIYVRNTVYRTSVGQDCQYDCIGNFFFTKNYGERSCRLSHFLWRASGSGLYHGECKVF